VPPWLKRPTMAFSNPYERANYHKRFKGSEAF